MINLLASKLISMSRMPASKAELNGSSYYRANPFYQQGYMPDSAYKNRKQQDAGQLPQGQDFFEPTNKKHFQRLGYYSTIAEQQLINSGVRGENSSAIKDKEYFRSLNVADIEGASTNTLISKAVKNRVKAQEELMRRAYEQRQAVRVEKMTSLEIMQEQKRRREALSRIKKAQEPNYHEVVKRMRTEEKEAMKARQMPKTIESQDRNIENDRMNQYRGQLDQTEKQIRQLQEQLSQVRKQRERAKTLHENQGYQPNPESITPVTYDQPYQKDLFLQNNYQHQINPEQYNYLPQKQAQQQYQLNSYDQPSTPIIQSRNQDNSVANSPPIQYAEEKQERFSPSMPLSGRPARQQHRRFNPTYLSYFSPSIGLAGKNIVGY